MSKSEKQNRRKFLSLGFLTGAAMLTQQVNAESVNDKEETIQLLTSDGRLVEVKKSIVQNVKSGKKVSNHEILNWTEVPKNK